MTFDPHKPLLRLIPLRELGDNKSASRAHSIDRNFLEDETIVNESLRVVIADDERPARSFLAAMLRGFEDVTLVGEAENGAEAVEVIERTKPDLAFLDLQMPEVDGLGVARLLKKNSMPPLARRPRTHSGAPSRRDRHPPGQRGRLNCRRRGVAPSDDGAERNLHALLSPQGPGSPPQSGAFRQTRTRHAGQRRNDAPCQPDAGRNLHRHAEQRSAA